MSSSDAQQDAASGPPRPQLALTLGITGHRANRIVEIDATTARVADVMMQLRAGIDRLETEPWFRADPPHLRVMSALAEGADRLVADIAMAHGFELNAVIPFAIDDYGRDFQQPAAAAAYKALLAAASRVLVLPGTRDPDSRAYALAGEALVAHSTILIAVWDGAAALGRGGTGEVVARAVESNVPVIHVPLDNSLPVRLLWSPFEPFSVTTRNVGVFAARPFTPEVLDRVLAELLLPPTAASELVQLRQFFAEPERRRNWRIEYPLLLALTGTQKLRRTAWNKADQRAGVHRDWAVYRKAGNEFAVKNAEMIDLVEDAYAWADHTASHYAQNLRGGHIVNFTFAALAVLVALASLVFPAVKLQLVLVEISIIGVIIINTRIGSNDNWQQRWLDYRILAERLRPLRSLKLLAVASPPHRPARKHANARRWVDWYVSAIWRAMGAPAGDIDARDLSAIRNLVAEHELRGEIDYHKTNAGRMANIDKVLHRLGSQCFFATIVLCGIFPILYFTVHDLVMAWAPVFVAFSAGLPAIGGATYALRVHGDYAGAAGRSIETAEALESIRSVLQSQELPMALSGALATAAARVMLVDLGEWQLTYEQRALAIPG